MKKLFCLSIVSVLMLSFFSSCKKDWTCECTNNNNDTELHTVYNATRNDAEVTCDDYEYHNVLGDNNCSLR